MQVFSIAILFVYFCRMPYHFAAFILSCCSRLAFCCSSISFEFEFIVWYFFSSICLFVQCVWICMHFVIHLLLFLLWSRDIFQTYIKPIICSCCLYSRSSICSVHSLHVYHVMCMGHHTASKWLLNIIMQKCKSALYLWHCNCSGSRCFFFFYWK